MVVGCMLQLDIQDLVQISKEWRAGGWKHPAEHAWVLVRG